MPEGCYHYAVAAPQQLPPGLGAGPGELTHLHVSGRPISQLALLPSQDAAALDLRRPRWRQTPPPQPPAAQYQPAPESGPLLKQMDDWCPPPPDHPEAYTWSPEIWDWTCPLCGGAQADLQHVKSSKHKKK